MNASAAHRTSSAGFTILELTVVIGLLAVFMMFLLQIVFTSTDVFQEGQAGQEQSAKTLAVIRPVEESVRDMIGPTFQNKRQASDARLLVQWFPIGLAADESTGEVQVLRSTIQVPKAVERRLMEDRFRAVVSQTIGANDPEAVAEAVAKLVRRTGLKGRGEMLLLPWPSGDEEGAYFDLRRGIFLPGTPLPFREAESASLLQLPRLGGRRFPAGRVEENTEVIATSLLHLSYRMATQNTESWAEAESTTAVDDRGPTQVWDSARAGWLLRGDSAAVKFPMDVGETSSEDSTDDVYPRYIEVTVVAGRGAGELPEAHLSGEISATERTIRLVNTDRLPADIPGNYVKIGSEWIQFGSMIGRTLQGVKRGVRGTRARSHPRQTGVRTGKTEVLMLKILHGSDSWNG